jgi:thiol-disulfide isomerase/thioredoxin
VKPLIALLISIGLSRAAQFPGRTEAPDPKHAASLSADEEQRILQEAVSQVGNSPVDFIRAMERHLRQHPQSSRRPELERAILRAAIDAKDNQRVILYGEKVLEHDNDMLLLDRVARALLHSDDPGPAKRSLEYSERLEKAADQARAKARRASEIDELDKMLARALVLQARGWGNTGDFDKAIAKARKSYEIYPTSDAAAERARWEVKVGRLQEAIEHYAEAFAIPDPKSTEENRRHDRAVMGELYRKLHGSEAGLGDLVLAAYDRTSDAVRARDVLRKADNPNADLQDAFQYRLSGLRNDSIHLADFHGKVIVLDFWATWCGPCRLQHPLFEQLKSKYKSDRDVVFLSINTDEDRSLVKPFVEEQKWSDQVYFEDGLALFYRVSSIPTTMIFNKRGEMASRIAGVVTDGFVELLTAKIEEARNE